MVSPGVVPRWRRLKTFMRAPDGRTYSSRSRGTVEGLPAIEEAIFAGVSVNVTLLFSREHYMAAAEAYLCGTERRIAKGLAPSVASVASLFVSRWDVAASGSCTRCAGQPARHCHWAADVQGILRPDYLATLQACDERRRVAAAPAAGKHGSEGSEGIRHSLRQGTGCAVHHQHDARRNFEGVCRSWRGRSADTRGWRRLRSGARPIRQRRHRRRCARGETAERRCGCVRQVLE